MEFSCICWWSNGTSELGGAKQGWAGVTFTVPATPSEYSVGVLNDSIRAVQQSYSVDRIQSSSEQHIRKGEKQKQFRDSNWEGES